MCGKLNLVYVEDNEIDIMCFKKALKKNNVKNPLHIYNNGEECLEALRDESFINERKIIITDLNMPKMNGIEMLQEIRKDEKLKSLIIFFLTTSKDDNDRIDAYNLNVAGYIVKPLSFNSFIDSISTLKDYLRLIEI